jgi:hypothetical protein
MKKNSLAELEARIQSWEIDSKIFADNMKLDKMEQELICELRENQEKVEQLVESDSEENIEFVLKYFDNLIEQL